MRYYCPGSVLYLKVLLQHDAFLEIANNSIRVGAHHRCLPDLLHHRRHGRVKTVGLLHTAIAACSRVTICTPQHSAVLLKCVLAY